MSAQFTVKQKKLISALTKKRSVFFRKAQSALFFGMRLFEGKLIKEQYTGRPGLNRPTGTLARGWFLRMLGSAQNLRVVLANSVVYGRIHDKSRPQAYVPGAPVSAYTAPFPERTDVEGLFEKEGKGILQSQFMKVIEDFIK